MVAVIQGGGNMAYMRGDYYLWRDGEDNLHIWAFDGYDSWDECSWAAVEDGETEDGVVRREGFEQASGVGIPNAILDQYVVMRLAQLLIDGGFSEAIDNALKDDGCTGSRPLAEHTKEIKDALYKLAAHLTRIP